MILDILLPTKFWRSDKGHFVGVAFKIQNNSCRLGLQRQSIGIWRCFMRPISCRLTFRFYFLLHFASMTKLRRFDKGRGKSVPLCALNPTFSIWQEAGQLEGIDSCLLLTESFGFWMRIQPWPGLLVLSGQILPHDVAKVVTDLGSQSRRQWSGSKQKDNTGKATVKPQSAYMKWNKIKCGPLGPLKRSLSFSLSLRGFCIKVLTLGVFPNYLRLHEKRNHYGSFFSLFDLMISICHLSVVFALSHESVGSSARTHADLSGIV